MAGASYSLMKVDTTPLVAGASYSLVQEETTRPREGATRTFSSFRWRLLVPTSCKVETTRAKDALLLLLPPEGAAHTPPPTRIKRIPAPLRRGRCLFRHTT